MGIQKSLSIAKPVNFYVGFILRPPKTSHCVDCDLCVEGYDHHCPWIGTCVGKRNYRFFVCFLVSLFFYCIFSLIICVLHVKVTIDKHSNWLEALEELGFTLVLIAYMVPFLGFVTGMVSFHVYLFCCGLNTREFFKKLHVRYDKRSFFMRFKLLFCSTIASVQYDYSHVKLASSLHKYSVSYSQLALTKQNQEHHVRKDTVEVRAIQAKADHNSSNNYAYKIVYTPDASSIHNQFI